MAWLIAASFIMGLGIGLLIAWAVWLDLRDARSALTDTREALLEQDVRATKAAARIRVEERRVADTLRADLAEAARWLGLYLMEARGPRGEGATLVNLARVLRVRVEPGSAPRLRAVK